MEKEKVRAEKFNEKKNQERMLNSALNNSYTKQTDAGPIKKLDGFAQGKGLIIGERVDHAAANQ